MDIWKYTPGFVARPLIRGIKAVRHTNEHRRDKLVLRRENARLEGMLIDVDGLKNEKVLVESMLAEANETIAWEVKARGDAEMLLADERAMNFAFRERYSKTLELMDDAIETTREVKRTFQDYVGDVLVGAAKDWTKRDWKGMGVRGAMIRKALDSDRRAEGCLKSFDELRSRYLDYVAVKVCEEEGVKNAPAMIYANDRVYSTAKFDRRVGSGHRVRDDLKDDFKLRSALERGKKANVEYGEGKLFFVPGRTMDGMVFSVAYYVPNGGKRSNIFSRLGKSAAKKAIGIIKYNDFGGELAFG